MSYSGEIVENSTKDGKQVNELEKEELIKKITSRSGKSERT